MGQKGSKIVVSETCLRPHHAHKCSDVDLRKLRALIKTGKLAPCFLPYEGEDWREKEVRFYRERTVMQLSLSIYGFTPSSASPKVKLFPIYIFKEKISNKERKAPADYGVSSWPTGLPLVCPKPPPSERYF